MEFRFILILVACVLLGCESNVDRLELERNVYKELLRYMGGDEASVLVISEQSTTGPAHVGEENNINKLENDAYKEFVLINKKASLLHIGPWWDKRVVILSKAEFDKIFNKSSLELSWKSYYREYPKSKGIIRLSRVGFNKELNEAFLYMEIGCGALCGNGYHAWMSKSIFGWKVVLLEDLWIS
jgi:hypothetical protein